MSTPRAYTNDEVRDALIQHVWALVRHWSNTRLEGADLLDPCRARVEGIAFSILATLDGSAGGLPGFVVAPSPHSSDEEDRRSEGENWFPSTPEIATDIAGSLHEIFFSHPAATKP